MKDYKDEKKLLCLAQQAEAAERYIEMCEFIKGMVDVKVEAAKAASPDAPPRANLKIGERNMLSVAYKNVVGHRRAAWRTMNAELEENGVLDTDMIAKIGKPYKQLIEEELEGKCREVLNLIETKLLPVQETINKMKGPEEDRKKKITNVPVDDAFSEDEAEKAVFYLKMCGDYYRYLAEFKKKQEVKDLAASNYDQAIDIANRYLAPTHPTRLGLVLNASVCRYEILNKPEEAKTLAKEGFDKAIQKLDSLSDSTYKDSTLIMQLLRDNLTIWQGSTDDAEREEQMD